MSLNITDGHDDHGMHTPAPTLPQESTLPSAGSPTPSPAPQDHVSSTPSPTLWTHKYSPYLPALS